jgi:hypothetical protein
LVCPFNLAELTTETSKNKCAHSPNEAAIGGTAAGSDAKQPPKENPPPP